MQLVKPKKIRKSHKTLRSVQSAASILVTLLAPGVLKAEEATLPPPTAPIAATPHARFLPEIFFPKESAAPVPGDVDLGLEAMKNGDYGNAIYFFNRARHNLINTADEQQNATLLLASAYLKANQIAEAQLCLREYAANNPPVKADFSQLLQGEIYQAQKKYSEAIKIFDEIIRQSPVGEEIYCRALNGRGMVKAEMQKYPEAMADFQLLLKAVAGSEWELTALTNAIKTTLKTRQLSESAALLEQAQKFKNDPGFDEINKLNLLQLFYEKKYADFTTQFKQEVEKNRDESPDPTLFGIATEAAKYYIANQAPGSAIPYLKGAIRCAANETERRQTMQTLIECYDRDKQLPEAINLMNKMLELYPAHPDNGLAAKYLAELYERNGQDELAAASCAQTLRNPAFNKAIRHWAGRTAAKLYRQLGSNDRAAEQLYYLYENLPMEENRNAEMLLLGEHFYLSGDFERALDLLKPLAHPGNKLHGAAQFLIIEIYLARHDGANALKYTQNLNQITDLEFREKCAFLRGQALFESRQYPAAAQTFAEFSRNYPKSKQRAAALLNAGKSAFISGDYPQSQQYLTTFIREFPENSDIAEAKYFMVKNFFMENKSREMAATIKEMSEKYPDNQATLGAFYQLLDFYKISGDDDSALQTLQDMYQLFQTKMPQILPQLLLEKSELLYKLKRYQAAAESTAELLNNYKDSDLLAPAAYLSGNISSDSGKYAQAITFYETALKSGKDANLLLNTNIRLADSYCSLFAQRGEKNDIVRAIEIYQKLLEQERKNEAISSQILYKLGKAYEQSGDQEQALKYYNELFYQAFSLRRKNLPLSEIWYSRAANSCILLYVRQKNRDSANKALKLIRDFRKFKLSGDDFEHIEKELKQRYHFK